MSPCKWLPPFAAAAALASPANAGPLTFQGALDRAVAEAPSLQATQLQVEAARASSRAAGALPDPKLSLGVEGFPVSGPFTGRPAQEDFAAARIGFMQDVPNRARRRASVAGASATISEAEAKRQVEVRRVKVATALAWMDMAYAERRLAALDQVLASLTPIWEAQPSAVAAGRSRPAQALAPIQLRAGLEDRRSELVPILIPGVRPASRRPINASRASSRSGIAAMVKPRGISVGTSFML